MGVWFIFNEERPGQALRNEKDVNASTRVYNLYNLANRKGNHHAGGEGGTESTRHKEKA